MTTNTLSPKEIQTIHFLFTKRIAEAEKKLSEYQGGEFQEYWERELKEAREIRAMFTTCNRVTLTSY